MSVHAVAPASFNTPRPQQTHVGRLPAPIKGIDGRSSLANGNLDNCIYCFNIVPSEYGMRVRKGFREYAVDVEDTPTVGLGVRTIVPFAGQGVVADKLFAVTNEGIWDVTVFNTPVLDQAFTDVTDAAGYAHYAHYVTDAGDDVLWVADSANGLFQYDPALGTWSVPAITGPDVTKIIFIMQHKQRVWMFEQDSSKAWYLDLGAIIGPATEFFFGNKFRHGGELVGLYNWTLDGGDGVDDYLIAISRGGDVIPYRGSDPAAAATWASVGTFFIGQMPFGTRTADEYAGELYLLSQFGVVAMSDLLKGVTPIDVSETSIAYKIARFVREDMAVSVNDPGWQMKFNGSDGHLLIGAPIRTDGTYRQYMQNLTTSGWGMWRDVPMISHDVWKGQMFFGTVDNKVYIMDVDSDNIDVEGEGGHSISWSMLTNYSDFSSGGMFKRGVWVRADFTAIEPPLYDLRVLYDYDFTEIPLRGDEPVLLSAVWDVAIWDQDIWTTGLLASSNQLQGGWGMGRTMAVAIRGKSLTRATLLSMDLHWAEGHGV